jgi:hypothetical protein
MEYFYIACSAASLAAFCGYMLEKLMPKATRSTVRITGSTFAVVTVLFWLWFYFSPANPVRNQIADKSSLVMRYTDGETEIGVVEGTFSIDSVTWGARVPLPPFQEPPEVSVYRDGTSKAPSVKTITSDMFIVEIDNSDLVGDWRFRARGKVYRRIDNAAEQKH